MAGGEVAQQDQLASEKDVRALLAERKYRSDASIGRLPFVEWIWTHAQEQAASDETQRGRLLRAAVWDIIEQHHQEALNGGKPCSVCAIIAGAVDWHVLWLDKSFTRRDGFERRYTHEELVALSSYAANDGDMERIQPQDAAIIRRLQKDGRLEPAVNYPIRKRRGLRWYGERAGRGRQALCAHLAPGDLRLQAAFARLSIQLQIEPAAPELTPTTISQNEESGNDASGEIAPQTVQQIRSPRSETPEAISQFPSGKPVHTGVSIGSVVLSRSRLVALARLLLVFATVTAIALVGIRLPWFAPTTIQTRPISDAQIAGFFVARQWNTGSARTLYAINAHSGESRPLWPDAAMLQGGVSAVAELGDFITDFSPAYLPARHLLAFIAEKGHTPNIWLAQIQMGSDGWPRIATSGPRELAANCACSALAWAPSGNWLLHDSPTGIIAVAPDTMAQQQVTNDGKDRWPACSPSGAWIAFQNALDDITALPSHDCIPIPGAAASARYLNGYRVAWRPAWSADGTSLAFVSNQGGQTTIYTVAFDHLAREVNLEDRTPTVQVSQGQCTDPLWAANQNTREPLVVFTCAPQASNPGHGALVAVPGASMPSWEASLDEGTLGRDSMCWLPE